MLERLATRGIAQSAALAVLQTGDRIEDYPQDLPYPSALLMGWAEGKPLHVVAAFDADHDWGYIITAYKPDLQHFGRDYRTRKSP